MFKLKFDEIIKKYRNVLIIFLAVSIFFLSAKASEWSSLYILKHLSHRVVPDDFLFSLIAYNRMYEYITEFIFYVMTFTFFYYVIKYAKKKLAYYWIIAWSYMFSRAFLNLLTPLERPLYPDLSHGLLRLVDQAKLGHEIYYRMGMFPSGHLGIATILYLAVKDVAPKGISRVMLSLLFLESVFMIAARGHYTIDIIGGVSFAILLYLIAEKYVKKYLIMK